MQQSLRQVPQALPSGLQAALRSRLGTVAGILGDCSRAGGDWEGAAGHYAESADQLRRAGGGAEVREGAASPLLCLRFA